MNNISKTNDPPQEEETIEKVAVFRFERGLAPGIKNRIKSNGCTWNTMLHGWTCPLSRQQAVQSSIEATQLICNMQIVTLPKGTIPINPLMANTETKLEILEEKHFKEDRQLLKDVCQYDPLLRPNDFSTPPSLEGKTQDQITIEADFHLRWSELQKTKTSIESLRATITDFNADPGVKIFDPEAPLLIADALIAETFSFKGLQTLQYCTDSYWLWDGIKYAEKKEESIRKIIYEYLRTARKKEQGGIEDFNPTKFRIDQIMDVLRAICFQEHIPASGAIWIDKREHPNPKKLIVFKNGILDVELWLKDPSIDLIPHTPLLLNANALNFDFNPEVPIPIEWTQFLNTIWLNDTESQNTLQEWIGYLLTQDTKYHKILLMVGPPRSGKGTIGRVLHELLGPSNVAGPTLSSLGGEFGLQPLLNKMLATISDARLSSKGVNSVIIERLLSISGEDPLTINRKFLDPVTAQLPTRMMIMTNELPNLKDASGALAKRYIVLTLEKTWLGNEDTSLINRLLLELPNIVIWALQGLLRLQQRGRFLQPTSSSQMIEELEALMSPIKAFIEERCDLSPLNEISVTDLFNAWENWCTFTRYPHAGNKQSFGRNLRAVLPGIQMNRPQDGTERERYYLGISLKKQNPSADVRSQSWNDFD